MATTPNQRLTAATDGSCLGNPGPGGWSWAVSGDEWAAGANTLTTNNLMELRAVHELLRVVPPTVPLLIQADSQYVINAFTKWIGGWRKRGWLTADRKPVANRTNIEMIAQQLDGRDVQWEWVRGHSGHPLNELVDVKARNAATAIRSGQTVDEGPGRLLRPIS